MTLMLCIVGPTQIACHSAVSGMTEKINVALLSDFDFNLYFDAGRNIPFFRSRILQLLGKHAKMQLGLYQWLEE